MTVAATSVLAGTRYPERDEPREGKLERAENNVLLDILFARQRINKHQQLAAHF